MRVCCQQGAAQSLTGTTGLLTIPTAQIAADGEISLGTSLLHKKYFAFGRATHRYQYHGMANFITLGYLPFLEISARLSRHLDGPQPQAIGDRMVSMRLRFLNERNPIPAVALGVHSPISNNDRARNFNASYLVASKTFRLLSHTKLDFHLGYGVDWLGAQSHQFVGVFGGLSFTPHQVITLMVEYDAERFNSGLRFTFFESVDVLVAVQNFDALSGGVNYRFRL